MFLAQGSVDSGPVASAAMWVPVPSNGRTIVFVFLFLARTARSRFTASAHCGPKTRLRPQESLPYSEQFFVVTSDGGPEGLSGSRGKLADFFDDFNRVCGVLPHFHICPGARRKGRGCGATVAHMRCVAAAAKGRAKTTCTLEDDARLTPHAAFCDESHRELVSSKLPRDAFVGLMGARQMRVVRSAAVAS